MRPRTISSHDPVEEAFRRIELVEHSLSRHREECAKDKSLMAARVTSDDMQFRSLRERAEQNEAAVNKLKEALTSGLLAEAVEGKRVAELEVALAREKAEREKERRLAIVIHCAVGALFGVVGLIAGAFGLLHR